MGTSFVGRRVELALLENVCSNAKADEMPAAAVVSGPPGSGKSRLLTELGVRHPSIRQLRVAGFEAGTHVPLAAAGDLLRELGKLVTEQRNPRSKNLDKLSTARILKLMNQEDRRVPLAVGREIRNIARAVDLIVERLARGGRLFYVGAGTSGRLGVLDATECPPTFGTPRTLVQGIIAGGRRALVRSVEGSEDDSKTSQAALRKHRVGERDVVVGIMASRRTPYAAEQKTMSSNTTGDAAVDVFQSNG